MTSSAGRVRRVLIATGEASGDEHAAGLVREALLRDPALRFSAIGGEALAAAGADVIHDAREISVVGITEVIERLPAIRRTLSAMKRRIRDDPPDAVLLVDFPDFNLRLAETAAECRVPVIYFVSPQVWAWRKRRVEAIRRLVTRMLVLFPFEERFYREHDVDAVCVGHPVIEMAERAISRSDARARLGIGAGGPVFGLLPGSRRGEVRRHLEPMLRTAATIAARTTGARFVMPVAGTVPEGVIEEPVKRSGLPVTAVRGEFLASACACDAAVAASGTATLQLAVLGVPCVVVYRMSPVSAAIARLAVRVPHVSLVNLVVGRRVVPELIQRDFTPGRAAEELLRIAPGGEARDAVLEGLAELRARLGAPGAYERAAAELLDVLDSTPAQKGESAP